MITHQMEVVRDACERVAVIDNGRVVESGLVKEIFSNPKTQTTRDFIKNIAAESSRSDSNNDNIVKWSEKSGSYLLHFVGESTEEPILSKITKELGVSFNILAAGISHLPDEEVGYMETDILGDEEAVEKAVEWLKENNVRVQKR